VLHSRGFRVRTRPVGLRGEERADSARKLSSFETRNSRVNLASCSSVEAQPASAPCTRAARFREGVGLIRSIVSYGSQIPRQDDIFVKHLDLLARVAAGRENQILSPVAPA
jgi:hypothetical protein